MALVAHRDQLERGFARLSTEHRTVLVLHHLLGLTAEETGRAIGIPVGTAKSRIHYATAALRAALEADARVLEIATIDALGLDNSIARARVLIAAVLAAAKLLETGELEERLAALEAAVRAGRRNAPEALFLEGEP
jgi:hypothetical protein